MSGVFYDPNAWLKKIKLIDILPTDEEITKYQHQVWLNTPSPIPIYYMNYTYYSSSEVKKLKKGPKNYKPLKHYFK